MLVVNFAHPLTDAQCAGLEARTGRTIERVIALEARFDVNQPFVEQARELVDSVGLSAAEWQAAGLVVNPPSHAAIASAVLAELHGRLGHFPALLRLRPVAGVVPVAYEVAEVLELQAARDAARSRR